jgi:hypothetical protein
MNELSYSNLMMLPSLMGLPLLTRQSFRDSLLNMAGLTSMADAKITAGHMHVRDGAAACAHIGDLNAERWYAARRALLTLN